MLSTRRRNLMLPALAALALLVAAFSPVAAAPKKALCLVCQVKAGTTEDEPVKAVRTYEGREYGFCSEDCAKEFMADPVAFLPPVLPRPAPAFAVRDFAGVEHSLETLRGKVALVDFWATWCRPCVKSMPALEEIHRRLAPRGLVVLGISLDEKGPAKVKQFARARKVTYPIALDVEKSPVHEAFRVKAIPAAFLIDREGRIVAQWTGAAPDEREVEAAIEKLLADAEG